MSNEDKGDGDVTCSTLLYSFLKCNRYDFKDSYDDEVYVHNWMEVVPGGRRRKRSGVIHA